MRAASRVASGAPRVGMPRRTTGCGVGGPERGALDHLMRHSGDSACDVTGGQQLTPLSRFRRTAVGRCHGVTSFPASLDGSLKDV